MSRLFITPREIDFFNDIAKEVVKDISMMKIYYYSISVEKSDVHDVYDEAINKVFERPVLVDALVEWQPEDVRTNEFGSEEISKIDVYIQSRDLLDKGIRLSEGDFFSYGDIFFEVQSYTVMNKIYGEVEFTGGVKLHGQSARMTQFDAPVFGPTDEEYSDGDAHQDPTYQQRGFADNQEGPTGDVRDLQKRGVLDAPLTGPSEISPRGTLTGSANSSFYEDQC